ncbi:MAG: ABC transporter permease [Acidobacteria bacterium]|nr:MAG: ABC transporter permease [Acidobacteriota bacterium]REK10593.1 MAG: ABC transporter permease [Acidobacteriota bacterium]
MRRFHAVFVARNKEFYRDRATLGWNLLFPLFILFGMAIVFSEGRQAVFEVAVIGEAPTSRFFELPHVRFTPAGDDLDAALLRVRQHRVDLLVDPGQRRYWLNSTSPQGLLVEQLLLAPGVEPSVQGRGPDPGWRRAEVEGRQIRYIDWLVPGLLSMNLMFSALFGVGFVIVRYRKNGVLRRLKATPLSAAEFLSAQVASRMVLIVATTIVVYVGSDWILDFVMVGSHALLLLILVLGALCLIALGLLLAARTASEELASGMLNIATFPMIGLSGVWFSIDSAPRWVHWVAQLLPLTHVNTAARAVMTDGAGLVAIAPQLGALAAMSLVFLGIGAALFRWE